VKESVEDLRVDLEAAFELAVGVEGIPEAALGFEGSPLPVRRTARGPREAAPRAGVE